jgi:Sulfotransferase family
MKFKIIHHADQETVNGLYAAYPVVFVLSTGRCGTKFLSFLLGHSPSIRAYHEASPTLQYFPNFAFHNQEKQEILRKMVDAGRMELILEALISDKIYLECNQCLTFFGPAIRDLFLGSKFVHVVRHPGDFVRSGLRKGWHSNDSIWESGRVRMRDEEKWQSLDQIQRLSWLWAATNQFMEEFKKVTSPDRVRTCRIEDLISEPDVVNALLTFMGAKTIPLEQIREIQKKRINELTVLPYETPNIRKVQRFPAYAEWPVKTKEDMAQYVSKLAALYDYRL